MTLPGTESFAVAPWATQIVGSRVAGSLYAAPPSGRVAAAAALARAGCDAHIDMIIRHDGSHRGVTPDEVRAVRAASPELPLDLHLILDAGVPPWRAGAALDDTVELALEVGAGRLSASSSTLAERPDAIAELRTAGVHVWVELALGEVDVDTPFDGTLVMLITPGTTEHADPARVEVLKRFAQHGAAGIDGGVTADIAAASAEAGAHTIVSGRALLIPATPRKDPSDQ